MAWSGTERLGRVSYPGLVLSEGQERAIGPANSDLEVHASADELERAKSECPSLWSSCLEFGRVSHGIVRFGPRASPLARGNMFLNLFNSLWAGYPCPVVAWSRTLWDGVAESESANIHFIRS